MLRTRISPPVLPPEAVVVSGDAVPLVPYLVRAVASGLQFRVVLKGRLQPLHDEPPVMRPSGTVSELRLRPGWRFNSIKKGTENLCPFFGPFFGCTFCPIESGLKFP